MWAPISTSSILHTKLRCMQLNARHAIVSVLYMLLVASAAAAAASHATATVRQGLTNSQLQTLDTSFARVLLKARSIHVAMQPQKVTSADFRARSRVLLGSESNSSNLGSSSTAAPLSDLTTPLVKVHTASINKNARKKRTLGFDHLLDGLNAALQKQQEQQEKQRQQQEEEQQRQQEILNFQQSEEYAAHESYDRQTEEYPWSNGHSTEKDSNSGGGSGGGGRAGAGDSINYSHKQHPPTTYDDMLHDAEKDQYTGFGDYLDGADVREGDTQVRRHAPRSNPDPSGFSEDNYPGPVPHYYDSPKTIGPSTQKPHASQEPESKPYQQQQQQHKEDKTGGSSQQQQQQQALPQPGLDQPAVPDLQQISDGPGQQAPLQEPHQQQQQPDDDLFPEGLPVPQQQQQLRHQSDLGPPERREGVVCMREVAESECRLAGGEALGVHQFTSKLGCCAPYTEGSALKHSNKTAAKPVTKAAAHLSSLRGSKGIFPRAGHTECVWVTHPLESGIQISRYVMQIGYATGTCYFGDAVSDCEGPFSPGLTITVQAEMYEAYALSKEPPAPFRPDPSCRDLTFAPLAAVSTLTGKIAPRASSTAPVAPRSGSGSISRPDNAGAGFGGSMRGAGELPGQANGAARNPSIRSTFPAPSWGAAGQGALGVGQHQQQQQQGAAGQHRTQSLNPFLSFKNTPKLANQVPSLPADDGGLLTRGQDSAGAFQEDLLPSRGVGALPHHQQHEVQGPAQGSQHSVLYNQDALGGSHGQQHAMQGPGQQHSMQGAGQRAALDSQDSLSQQPRQAMQGPARPGAQNRALDFDSLSGNGGAQIRPVAQSPTHGTHQGSIDSFGSFVRSGHSQQGQHTLHGPASGALELQDSSLSKQHSVQGPAFSVQDSVLDFQDTLSSSSSRQSQLGLHMPALGMQDSVSDYQDTLDNSQQQQQQQQNPALGLRGVAIDTLKVANGLLGGSADSLQPTLQLPLHAGQDRSHAITIGQHSQHTLDQGPPLRTQPSTAQDSHQLLGQRNQLTLSEGPLRLGNLPVGQQADSSLLPPRSQRTLGDRPLLSAQHPTAQQGSQRSLDQGPPLRQQPHNVPQSTLGPRGPRTLDQGKSSGAGAGSSMGGSNGDLLGQQRGQRPLRQDRTLDSPRKTLDLQEPNLEPSRPVRTQPPSRSDRSPGMNARTQPSSELGGSSDGGIGKGPDVDASLDRIRSFLKQRKSGGSDSDAPPERPRKAPSAIPGLGGLAGLGSLSDPVHSFGGSSSSKQAAKGAKGVLNIGDITSDFFSRGSIRIPSLLEAGSRAQQVRVRNYDEAVSTAAVASADTTSQQQEQHQVMQGPAPAGGPVVVEMATDTPLAATLNWAPQAAPAAPQSGGPVDIRMATGGPASAAATDWLPAGMPQQQQQQQQQVAVPAAAPAGGPALLKMATDDPAGAPLSFRPQQFSQQQQQQPAAASGVPAPASILSASDTAVSHAAPAGVTPGMSANAATPPALPAQTAGSSIFQQQQQQFIPAGTADAAASPLLSPTAMPPAAAAVFAPAAPLHTAATPMLPQEQRQQQQQAPSRSAAGNPARTFPQEQLTANGAADGSSRPPQQHHTPGGAGNSQLLQQQPTASPGTSSGSAASVGTDGLRTGAKAAAPATGSAVSIGSKQTASSKVVSQFEPLERVLDHATPDHGLGGFDVPASGAALWGGSAIVLSGQITSVAGYRHGYDYEGGLVEFVARFDGEPLSASEVALLSPDIPFVVEKEFNWVFDGDL